MFLEFSWFLCLLCVCVSVWVVFSLLFNSFVGLQPFFVCFFRCLNCMYPQSRSLFSVRCGVDLLLLLLLLLLSKRRRQPARIYASLVKRKTHTNSQCYKGWKRKENEKNKPNVLTEYKCEWVVLYAYMYVWHTENVCDETKDFYSIT